MKRNHAKLELVALHYQSGQIVIKGIPIGTTGRLAVSWVVQPNLFRQSGEVDLFVEAAGLDSDGRRWFVHACNSWVGAYSLDEYTEIQ